MKHLDHRKYQLLMYLIRGEPRNPAFKSLVSLCVHCPVEILSTSRILVTFGCVSSRVRSIWDL